MYLELQIEEAGYSQGEPIIKDLQFSVGSGELVGLIGPNGAGKSSTIKAILGILKYLKGNVTVGTYSYIPERPIFYEGLTLWEHVEFLFSTLDQSDASTFFLEAHNLIDLFNLTRVIHQYPETFSKGMQQKLMVILAFLKKPDLYIIDEPFMGLDPKGIKKFLMLIEEEKRRGAGILMSTHVLDSAEKFCDRFILIMEGQVLVQGTLEEIQKKSGVEGQSLFDCFDQLTEPSLK